MNILFVTKYFLPHVGGVEKQVAGLSNKLIEKGNLVTILTWKYNNSLPDREKIGKIRIIRVRFPQFKYVGLIYTWFWFASHIDFLDKYDVVHFHSSYIWYWPLKLLRFNKPSYVTFHGSEGIYPVPFKNRLIKQIDAKLAAGTIAISGYLEKWYGFKADDISWTSLEIPPRSDYKKDYKKILYVGRLDENTGLRKILSALKKLNGFQIDFCGDGPLRAECEKIGDVHGFTDPSEYYKDAFIFVANGITSILEALSYKCLVITTYTNPLMKEYVLTNPHSKWLVVEKTPEKMAEAIRKYSMHPGPAKERIEQAYEWVKTQNWDNEVNRYLKLWKQQ